MHIIRGIRSYFDTHDFMAVETPIMQTMPGADVHIHAYRLDNGQYLQNSPEFAMKKLLVAGCERIYQICPVFRKEERTKRHNPEFTMLEWYRTQADYTDIMQDCIDLIQSLNIKEFRHGDQICDPFAHWEKLSVAEAFTQYADIEINEILDDLDGFKAAAKNANIRTTDTDNWDDVFHAIMAEKIEPYLGQGAPTILHDYPVSMAALSRKKPSDPRYAERFELYICGVELANAFSELTDAIEQRKRFTDDMAQKQRLYDESYPLDEEFLQALEYGLPECAGIALGVDRLIMLAAGAKDIKEVLWTAS